MSAHWFGLLLAFGSAASFALSNICISRTSGSGGDKGVLFSVVVTMGLAAALWVVLDGACIPANASPAGLVWFGLAGLAAMVFGRSLLYASVRALGVARSSAVKRLNPFFSVLLAALILGEALRWPDAVGMVAIATAFALMVGGALRRAPGEVRVQAYMLGVGSALAYAFSYVFRKLGLDALPSPALGTLVSAVAGFAVFALLAAVNADRRANLLGMFRQLDRWVVFAALLVSAGQILLFAALAHADVASVVMVASLEIFISIGLSVFVFRSEPMPGRRVLLAAGLAMAGVVLVAI